MYPMITLGCLSRYPRKGGSICYNFDEGRVMFLSKDRSYYFIRKVSQMRLKLANGPKLVEDGPGTDLSPVSHCGEVTAHSLGRFGT